VILSIFLRLPFFSEETTQAGIVIRHGKTGPKGTVSHLERQAKTTLVSKFAVKKISPEEKRDKPDKEGEGAKEKGRKRGGDQEWCKASPETKAALPNRSPKTCLLITSRGEGGGRKKAGRGEKRGKA